jgi:hypothetical protein
VPLVGVIDPSHKSAEEDWGKPGVLPAWVTLEEAQARVLGDIKWAPWTYELIHAMFAEHQERDYLSSSALNAACPRAEVLKRSLDYVTSLKDLYIPFRGTMVHRTMEYHADERSIAEARFWTTIDGIEVSCSPDLLRADALFDYKVTETPPMYSYPYVHHKEQVELNAFITRHAERWELPVGRTEMPFDPHVGVKHVALVYMGPKYVKVLEVEKKEEVFDGKTGKFKKVQMPFVWPDKLVLKVFRPRLHLMHNALATFPEWPEPWYDVDTKKTYTAEEVWGGEPGWTCPGPPLCGLPDCLARRWPKRLMWDKEGVGR